MASTVTVECAGKNQKLKGQLRGVLHSATRGGVLSLCIDTVPGLRHNLWSASEFVDAGAHIHLHSSGGSLDLHGVCHQLRRSSNGCWVLDFAVNNKITAHRATSDPEYERPHSPLRGAAEFCQHMESEGIFLSHFAPHVQPLHSAATACLGYTYSDLDMLLPPARPHFEHSIPDPDIASVKNRGRLRGCTTVKVHYDKGHLGEFRGPPCDICRMVLGSLRRIRVAPDGEAYDTRPGYTWNMDAVTIDCRSTEGYRYGIVLRDEGSEYFSGDCASQRSDFPAIVCEIIVSLRRFFRNPDLFHCIRTDMAGEWGPDAKKFEERLSHLDPPVNFIYVSPDTKRRAGRLENAIWCLEVQMKKLLFSRALPPTEWAHCFREAMWLLNIWPTTRERVSRDGDSRRPIEILSKGSFSRSMCDNLLYYYVPYGTPCLIHLPKVKGSSLNPKVRWGVAIGMTGDTPHFKCPITKDTFRSKSYVAIALHKGVSYYDLFGLERPTVNSRVDIIFQKPHGKPFRSISLELLSGFADDAMRTLPASVSTRGQKWGGVHVTDPAGRVFAPDADGTLRLTGETIDEVDPPSESAHPDRFSAAARLSLNPRSFVGVNFIYPHESGIHAHATIRKYDSKRQLWGVKFAEGLTATWFGRVQMRCHVFPTLGAEPATTTPTRVTPGTGGHEAPAPEVEGGEPGISRPAPADPPSEWGGSDAPDPISTATPLPKASGGSGCDPATPSGGAGSKAVNEPEDPKELEPGGLGYYTTPKQATFHSLCDTMEIPKRLRLTYNEWLCELGVTHSSRSRAKKKFFSGKKFPFPCGKRWEELCDKLEAWEFANQQRANNALYCEVMTHIALTAYRTEVIPTPKTVSDREEFRAAIDEEFGSILAKDVFDLCTLKEARARGITSSPIPMKVIFNRKYSSGVFERNKVRNVLCGHRGAMRHGEHFWETFSAAPNLASSRVLQAIAATKGWHRCAYDIRTAYLNAPIPRGAEIVARFAPGFRQHNDEGDELFAVLKRNLYGHPGAARAWSTTRDKWILHEFMQNGWRVEKMRMEPCMFKLFPPNGGEPLYLLVYTDDVDTVGPNMSDLECVRSRFSERWEVQDKPGVKEVDPGHMLGVDRHRDADGNIHICMPSYVDFVHKKFPSAGDRAETTPFPVKLQLNKAMEGTPLDKPGIKRYQELTGALLWVARNVFWHCSYGVAQLCRMMSCPNTTAWNAALHMVRYLKSHRDFAIIYRKDAPLTPVCFYDASFKPDPSDGKSQYGFMIAVAGALVIWESKKLPHVGLSSHHTEYMALCIATRTVVWLRQLFAEMGFELSDPTLMFGDNDHTTKLAYEDIVTSGNKYFYLPYHYSKEATELGNISTVRVNTDDNFSDALTKSVPEPAVSRLVPGISGHDSPPLSILMVANMAMKFISAKRK